MRRGPPSRVALFLLPFERTRTEDGAMTTPSSGPSGFDDEEVNLGGADAVPKSSYVPGSGTEHERRKGSGGAVPAVSAGGLGLLGWSILALAIAIAAYFAMGLF